MNKFLTHEGGQPIWLEDIDFMQNSWRETAQQIVASMTGDSDATCVLSGCLPDENGGTTSGIVCINGEIMQLRPSSLNWSNSFIKVVTEMTGERSYKSGSKKKCHEIRYAVLDSEGDISTTNIPSLCYQSREYGSDDLNVTPGTIKVIRHGGLLTITGFITLEKQENNIQAIEVATLPLSSPLGKASQMGSRTLAVNYMTPYTPVPIEVRDYSNAIKIWAYPGPDTRTDQYSFCITI